jgi:hypothetical protein
MQKTEVKRQIEEVREILCLNYEQVGRMLGIKDRPGLTVWCWIYNNSEKFGTEPFGPNYEERLKKTYDAVQRLCKLFAPKRIWRVIRRRAEVFSGERALDLILRGEILKVVETYERLLEFLNVHSCC